MSTQATLPPETPAEAKSGGGVVLQRLFSRRYLAADLFCCAGGAGMGISRAGFDVEGWDIENQPRYPFAFHCENALDADLSRFDLVWASPPCQRFTRLNNHHREKYPDLVDATRAKLKAWGGPYIIENVVGAPLENPLRLTGEMFGLRTKRPRLFESNVFMLAPPSVTDSRTMIKKTGDGGYYYKVHGHNPGGAKEWGPAMGIDWMNRAELAQAIPPAFSEFLVRQIMQKIKAANDALCNDAPKILNCENARDNRKPNAVRRSPRASIVGSSNLLNHVK